MFLFKHACRSQANKAVNLCSTQAIRVSYLAFDTEGSSESNFGMKTIEYVSIYGPWVPYLCKTFRRQPYRLFTLGILKIFSRFILRREVAVRAQVAGYDVRPESFGRSHGTPFGAHQAGIP